MEKTLELPNVLRAIDFTVLNSAAACVCVFSLLDVLTLQEDT